ncbi:hypothetical protein ACH5RR_005185 [Cinchona calisaya]|uniref:Uncharacterized protein n=1 Tax=Cinchona calisaya TaxID=153742 RepID=A0ABD3AKM9_9GENT
MEEEEKEAVINGKRPGKLNFNAPLISIRRPVIGIDRLQMPNANSHRVSWDNCERIPFSWEQTPGKPKDLNEASDSTTENVDHIPRPKPPPGRWVPANYDDGCEGDVDDDDDDDDCKDDDVSSNALDIFSLAQSVDTVETWDKLRKKLMCGNLEKDGLKLDTGIGSHSPNFMIQRFLPDAKALAAASSSIALSKDINENKYPKSNSSCTSTITSVSRAMSLRESTFCSSKGCGLDIFLPWRMKPKPCGVKSPVMSPATSKPRRSRRQ